ncbi:MAG: D-alanyl-D-alanine carboxypeptidase, partial [Kiloniellales bacterium]
MLRSVTSRSQTMNRPLRNALAAAFAILALTLAQIPQAQARYAALVIDADSGRVLYEVNADTRNY